MCRCSSVVEQRIRNARVEGSSPPSGSSKIKPLQPSGRRGIYYGCEDCHRIDGQYPHNYACGKRIINCTCRSKIDIYSESLERKAGSLMLNRRKLQTLAKIRCKDADMLLRNSCYSGSYYLCGYAVECAIKACIAKRVKRYEFPSKALAQGSYTHNLTELLKTASLWPSFELEMKGNRDLEIYWSVIKDWSEESRYKRYTRQEATDLYNAVNDQQKGILKWIIQYW